jgi:hypothetical protein
LTLLLSILVNQIAPILLCAGAGYSVGRAFKIDLRAISRLTFYVFSPCLVFVSLTENHLSGEEFGRMAVFTALTVLALGAAAFLFGRALRLDRHTVIGLMVVNMFGNGGNYGLSLNKFAFGPEALSRAVVYYLISTVLVYTLGIVVASSGRAPLGKALRGVFALPAVYGLLLAILLRLTGWSLPIPLQRSVDLLSQAAIPVMLIVLGLQLAEARRPENLRLVTAASVFQLLSGPAIGLLLAYWLGLSGPARQAAVIEAAMPTAVITTIIAVEYDIDPALVTGIVLVTTLLSPITLTSLVAYLQQ